MKFAYIQLDNSPLFDFPLRIRDGALLEGLLILEDPDNVKDGQVVLHELLVYSIAKVPYVFSHLWGYHSKVINSYQTFSRNCYILRGPECHKLSYLLSGTFVKDADKLFQGYKVKFGETLPCAKVKTTYYAGIRMLDSSNRVVPFLKMVGEPIVMSESESVCEQGDLFKRMRRGEFIPCTNETFLTEVNGNGLTRELISKLKSEGTSGSDLRAIIERHNISVLQEIDRERTRDLER